MAFTMACSNFKKGLKMAFGPLGVNIIAIKYAMNILLYKRKLENNQPLPTILN
jgi:hypothetical protein